MSCTPSRPAILGTFLCAFLFVTTVCASAQTFTSLASFNGTSNGSEPYYVYLVQGLDGNLYGTTTGGGADSSGTVFKLTPAGKVTAIYNFCSEAACADGSTPYGGLVLATNGFFYGTTSAGGGTANSGTVYKITAAGALTVMHTFDGTDGELSYVGMIQATNGTLYGTTSAGGSDGAGAIFEMTPAGGFTSLISAGVGIGKFPDARLVQGTNGNLYGVSYDSGVYELTLAGKVIFGGNTLGTGSGSTSALVQASNGSFYGTTAEGGANNSGTVFEMTSGGTAKTIYSFCTETNCTDGSTPWAGLILGTDGNLYGTASVGGSAAGGTPGGAGTIFKITTAGKLTTLYTFCTTTGCPDGANPYEGLTQATNGMFYGTTYSGGTSNLGTVYSLSTGLEPFVQPLTTSGKVGASVILLGTDLTGSTAVSFNGTAAAFKVVSATEITATVPAGALTGTIKVTTPGGVLASNATYRVTPQITTFSPPSGTVGTTVTIMGVSLTETSEVTFGGVSASFTVDSDTQVTATVPTGAKTGKIVITTPGGTATGATSFTVTT